ncbi:RFC checkpoint protein Rad17 [Sporothrix bragantina]|uniref:RFC checkpoint protein Rad17 n=1 Tax=Sporothrix bragantina TaxID=671064 RepID=A0ABP0AY19_9PEZI
MSASSQPKSVIKRTYWTRQYVFSCNHTTVRHCGVKKSSSAIIATPATPATPATNAVPFLMPIRVNHECITCVGHKLVTRLEEKAKAVRSGFTLLCHGLDAIVKETEKQKRMKSKTIIIVERPGDDNNNENDDSQIQQDESWDDQPPTLDSLMPIYSSGDTSRSSEDGHLRLSEKIRQLRGVLEQCIQSQGDATPSGDNATADTAVDASNADMANEADTSDTNSPFGDSMGDTIRDILESVGDVISAIADGLDTGDI